MDYLLAIIAFSFCLLGTFIVRSGVLVSVHAFASDPSRGLYILLLLVFFTGGGLALFAKRAPYLKSGSLFKPLSREGALVINNIIFASAAATVLLGTLYPIFIDAINNSKVSVGPPYFEAVFIPLMVPAILLCAFSPMLSWKRAIIDNIIERNWKLDEIKMIEGLLFISMLPLHSDNLERQLALFCIGIERLNEIFGM